MMTESDRVPHRRRTLDGEWPTAKERMKQLMNSVGESEVKFTALDYITFHTIATNLSSLDGYDLRLFDYCKATVEEFILSAVKPCIKEKRSGEQMLREVVKRWNNHKKMVRMISHIFNAVETALRKMERPLIIEVGMAWFYDLVYWELKDAVSLLVREGNEIEEELMNNVHGMLFEMEKGGNKIDREMLRMLYGTVVKEDPLCEYDDILAGDC